MYASDKNAGPERTSGGTHKECFKIGLNSVNETLRRIYCESTSGECIFGDGPKGLARDYVPNKF